MLAYLEGEVLKKDKDFLILKVDKVGYKVLIEPTFHFKLKEGEKVKLYCYLYSKEGLFELYGFPNFEELSLFEKLLQLQGIGPKVALRLSVFKDLESLIQALKAGEVKIQGLGKKKLERLKLELLGILDQEKKEREKINQDLKEALKEMGFDKRTIKEVLSKIDPNLKLAEKIKLALNLLSNKE